MKSFKSFVLLFFISLVSNLIESTAITKSPSSEGLQHDFKYLTKVKSVFKELLKSKPKVINLTELFKEDAESCGIRTLAFLILVSIVRRDSRFFTEQFVLTCQEGNINFNEFVSGNSFMGSVAKDKRILSELAENEDLTLKSFLLDQGMFEFILMRDDYSFVDSILKEVESLARILCPKKAERISIFTIFFPLLEPLNSKNKINIYRVLCKYFIDRTGIVKFFICDITKTEGDDRKLSKFYSDVASKRFKGLENIGVAELGYQMEEIKWSKALVEYILDSKNCETTLFFKSESNSASLPNFLCSSKSNILVKLREKGLFFVLANYFSDKNVQKLLRMLDSRFRVHCRFCKVNVDRLNHFWSSLSILRNVNNIDYLVLILIRYTFHQRTRDFSIFSEITKNEEAFIENLISSNDLGDLNQWQLDFNGFISPNFLFSPNVKLLLRDFGLSSNEIVHSIFGLAMYVSFFGERSFTQVFDEIKSASGPQKIFVLENKDLEEISKKDCFFDVFASINTFYPRPHYSAIKFFYQHTALFKTERKAQLLEKYFEHVDLTTSLTAKMLLDSKDVQKIMFILANAYMGEENTNILRDANFLSYLNLKALSKVASWMKSLSFSFYKDLIGFPSLNNNPGVVYDILKTFCPDKK